MNNSSKFHYGFVIVFCCCLIMGINIGLVMSCAGIFYKPVSNELGVSVGDFGLYMTFIYLFSTLTLSVAGKLMDKYSARWLLTLSSAILGFVFLGMSTFNEVWQFYAAGAVIGVTLAFLLYLSYPTMINRWFNSKVGFFIGVCSAASGIGGVIFNPLGGHLIANYGWRSTYLIFGIIILVLVTPLLGILLRNYPADKGENALGEKEVETAKSGVAYNVAIKSSVFYALIVFAFMMISVSTLNLFLPTYVISVGYSVEQSAFVASAVMLGVTVGKVALGYINDKSALSGVLTSVGLGIAGFVFILFGTSGIVLMTIGGFLFGWAYAGVTVFLALCLGLTCVQAQESNLQLKGTVTDTVAQYVYLQKFNNKMFKTIDSVKVKDGCFSFNTNVKTPELYGLSVDTANSPLYIFLENKPIIVKISPKKYYSTSVIEGSESQNLFDAYRKTKDIEISKFITEHPKSIVSAYVLYRNWSYRLTPEEITGNIALLDKIQQNSIYVKELNELITVLNGLAVGNKAPDFTANNPEGKPVRLSENLKGYTLIDFWASWCGPCRKENPNVVAAYKEFHGKGFNIIGVSLDKKKENWIKGIKDDNLDWQHVSDLKFWNSEIAKLYGVRAIPGNYLIDSKGLIVAKNLQGEELQSTLKKLLDNKL
jgi:peroxiredoxin/sugar phosphate permease